MVNGIDKFREAFKDFSDNYIVIGGAACDIILDDETEVEPRATVDIDMILVVGNINAEFGKRFWNFISEGEYKTRQRKRGEDPETKPELFRFLKPKLGYPAQIELLSIKPDILGEPTGYHLTPIPLGEDLSSLSAILMDKDCYEFTLANSLVENGIRVASPAALIALKSRAFLNLSKEKLTNPNVRSRDIKKHRVDVFLLMSQFSVSDRVVLPSAIADTLREFVRNVESELPIQSLQAVLGVGEEVIREYLSLMKTVFNL